MIPLTRNWTPNNVFPQPALPHTSVGRPLGKPPLVTSSRPDMPVGVFGNSVFVFDFIQYPSSVLFGAKPESMFSFPESWSFSIDAHFFSMDGKKFPMIKNRYKKRRALWREPFHLQKD